MAMKRRLRVHLVGPGETPLAAGPGTSIDYDGRAVTVKLPGRRQ
jgi:hypothetical protein